MTTSIDEQKSNLKPSTFDKLFLAGKKIANEHPSSDDIAFMPTILCRLGMPRQAVEGCSYERRCNGLSLNIRAGHIFDGMEMVSQPIPYGAMPRLILSKINTTALKTHSPVVNIGHNASEILRSLGFKPSGGPRGPYTMFMQQMQSLASCRITMRSDIRNIAYSVNGGLIDEIYYWSTFGKNQTKATTSPGTIVLNQKYYENLKDHAVPLDSRALYALKGSSLALDLYMMLAERLHRSKSKRLIVRWNSLRDQFSQDYKGINASRNFKREFKSALTKVLIVYPRANVSVIKTGIIIKPSHPPVPYKN